jgi:hypothetical protein
MGFVCNFAEEWPDSFMRTEEPDFVDMVVKRTGRRTAATSLMSESPRGLSKRTMEK